ncbi:MAG TPA: STAS domain-containing protein [Chloroflexaceae bacterium]|nr:STAS domain-containing protein [Chloroflexaceae bacterium]
MSIQRRVTLALILVLLVGGLAIAVLSLANVSMVSELPEAPIYGLTLGSILMLLGFWRGVDQVRYAIVVLLVLLAGFGLNGVFLADYASIAIILPPVLALVLAGPAWVVGSAAATIFILAARAGFSGVYADPLTLVVYGMIVGGMILARMVTEAAQHSAEEQARRAEAALAQSEDQAAELARKAEELARQNDEQRRLLDLVATLETPAVALAEGVLLAPVVGHLDSRRADLLTERLLREVSAKRTRMVVLDIAGVPAVDTAVAHALLRAVQAVRLLGCEVTITGISASIAATITQLGITLVGAQIARTPQEALEQAVVATANGARR